MQITAKKVSRREINVVLYGGTELRGEVTVDLYDDDGKMFKTQRKCFKKHGTGRISNFACLMFELGQIVLPGEYTIVAHLQNYAPYRQTIMIPRRDDA